MSKTDPVYTIGIVERMTGLTARRIRYYEEMGLVKPFRTAGNQRQYSAADVERLQEIKRLIEDGFKINDLKEHYMSRYKPQRTITQDPVDKLKDPELRAEVAQRFGLYKSNKYYQMQNRENFFQKPAELREEDRKKNK